MSKGALLFVVLGAICAVAYTCPLYPYYACVKDDKPKKCTAVKVCEKPTKEKCGYTECEYPKTCASIKKSICKDFLRLKQKCEQKKECKEIKKPCGHGACKISHDCVKENFCYIKTVPGHRKLMDGSVATAISKSTSANGGKATSHAGASSINGGEVAANSHAVAKGKGSEAHSDAFALAEGDRKAKPVAKAFALGKEGEKDEKKKDVYVYPYKEVLVCEEKFSCVAKEPCKDVIIKKCVRDVLKPGIDVCHGGYSFYWADGYVAEKCGDEYCGAGYKCAEVVIQKCKTPCGDDTCEYGEECVTTDKECEDYAYLETVCKDVYEPTCVELSPYVKLYYKPPCKTIWKCEEEEAVCGNEYCPEGYECAVEEKESCEAKTYYVKETVEDPEKINVHPKKVVPVVNVPEPETKTKAVAVSEAFVGNGQAKTHTATLALGEGAEALAAAKGVLSHD